MPATYSVSFITREGFVAVIRRVRTFFDPLPNLSRSEVLCTLFVNGGALDDNINIPVGPAQDDLINCFVIVDELQEFRVTVNTTPAADPNSNFYAHVYGNYLLKTDMPANMQIASCMGGPRGGGVEPRDMPDAAIPAVPKGPPPGYNAPPVYRPKAPAAPMVTMRTPRASAPVTARAVPVQRPAGVLTSGRNKR